MNRRKIGIVSLIVAGAVGLGWLAGTLTSGARPGAGSEGGGGPPAGLGHGAHEGAHGGEERAAPLIQLTSEQLRGLRIETVEVRRGSLTELVDLPGVVEWNSDRLVHLTPRVSGIVTEVRKTLGDRVEEGDVLCLLDSREMGDAKMEFLADLSRFDLAQVELERARVVYENTAKLLEILAGDPPPERALEDARALPAGQNKNRLLTTYTRMRVKERSLQVIQELLERKIASEIEHLQAKGEAEVARADYASSREEITFDLEPQFTRARRDFQVAQTEMRNSERALAILGVTEEEIVVLKERRDILDHHLSWSPIYSTLSGIIVDRHLTPGERVDTETRLYTIAVPTDVWVMGRVYERDLRFLRVGQKAVVRLDALPGESFSGTIDYIGSQLKPETRTVEVRVVLPNPGGRFRAGMFGSVTVFAERPGGERPGALLVPVAALQRSGDGHVVYQVLAEGRYRQIPVRVLAQAAEFAEVAGDLEPGSNLAAGETFILRSEAGRELMGEGHEH